MKHFVNLTNGIEAIPSIQGDYGFIRIQSTICEAKHWNRLIQDLDNNFLMSIALGYECHVYDYSNNKDIPRSLYQGMEFIKWILSKRWFNREYTPMVKHSNCQGYFASISLDRVTKRKLDYFKKFLNTPELNIVLHTGRTVNDGNYGWYSEVLRSAVGMPKIATV